MWTKILQSAGQSCGIMTLADLSTQYFVEGKQQSVDTNRTLRWTSAGLLHGPYFLLGFSAIDKFLVGAGKTSLKVVAQKTAMAQFILFPPYLVALFGLMGTLEGHSNVVEKIRLKVPEAFLSGCFYWPIANAINFAFVPPSLRVPYVASAAGLWNGYLSWENERGSNTNMLEARSS